MTTKPGKANKYITRLSIKIYFVITFEYINTRFLIDNLRGQQKNNRDR